MLVDLDVVLKGWSVIVVVPLIVPVALPETVEEEVGGLRLLLVVVCDAVDDLVADTVGVALL